jgi:hypothetical protein
VPEGLLEAAEEIELNNVEGGGNSIRYVIFLPSS